MKKILYIYAILALISVCACSESYEQMLMGKWTLEKSSIKDIDSFCEYQSRKTIEELEKTIKQIDMELETADAAHKSTLEQRRSTVEQQMAQSVPDSVRANIEDNLNSLVGNFFFEFRSNKSFSLSSPNDSVSGIWSLKGDSLISTLISGRPAEDIVIMSLTNTKMQLTATEIDDDGYELTTVMDFRK